jgi:apolipoprotein D and lipocalin family protein
MKKLMVGIASLLLAGCLGYPKNLEPVRGFELEKYMGQWYEIARLDHSFERNLEQVSAEYSVREDGGVRVKNRGFSVKENKWKQVVGKAYFAREPDEGYLKVSFFGPFYGSYVIFELDKKDYQYAFVSGPSTSYLWFLSRTPTVSAELKEKFQQTAAALGYNTEELIWVRH